MRSNYKISNIIIVYLKNSIILHNYKLPITLDLATI